MSRNIHLATSRNPLSPRIMRVDYSKDNPGLRIPSSFIDKRVVVVLELADFEVINIHVSFIADTRLQINFADLTVVPSLKPFLHLLL